MSAHGYPGSSSEPQHDQLVDIIIRHFGFPLMFCDDLYWHLLKDPGPGLNFNDSEHPCFQRDPAARPRRRLPSLSSPL